MQRLRQDDVAEGLEPAHADGARRLPLALADGLDRAAVDLAQKRAVLQGDADDAAGEFGRIQAKSGRPK